MARGDGNSFVQGRNSTKLFGTGIGQMGRSVLEAIFGAERLSRLPMDEIDPDDLFVDVIVTYNRSTTTEGHIILDNLARMASDLDAQDTELIIPGVGKVTEDMLKLSKGVSVQTFNGEVSQNDLFPKMQRWLEDLIKDGQIDD